MGLLAGTGGGG